MAVPLIAGVMFGVGTVLTGSHAVRKAHETQEFWKNYRKNTGLSTRYPFRSGVYDFYRDIGRTSLAFGALYGNTMSPARSVKSKRRPRRR